MKIIDCWRDGARRVNHAPAILFGMFALTILMALPLGLVVRGMIAGHLGSSLAADTAADRVNYDWWNEFMQQSSGLGTTFVPSIIGFAAPLRNLSDLIDNAPMAATMAGVVAAFLLLWAFLTGGVLDRYARGRTLHTPGFFAACGVFFFRFLRLGVIAFVLYAFLFWHVHDWLFDASYDRWTRDVDVERQAFFIRVLLYVIFGALLAAVNLVMDYAKIRAVVEDRRSMIGAVAASARFVFRHTRAALALYLLNTFLFAVILLAYRFAAPGGGWHGLAIWIAFAIGELYILARVWAKLLFLASQTSLFQSRLAHAAYAAFPAPAPSDPPIVDALATPPISPQP